MTKSKATTTLSAIWILQIWNFWAMASLPCTLPLKQTKKKSAMPFLTLRNVPHLLRNGDFLKSGNKKSFRQAHAEDIAKYEEALRILKQHSPDGRFSTMKDLRAEKEQLTIQKDAQYDTYNYFRDYYKELQTVCANVDNILGTEREVQREQQQFRKSAPSL